MKKKNTSDRLKEIMELRNLKQIDIVNLAKPYCKQYDIKLGRNDISQYIAGKVEPAQNKLFVLSKALNVNVAWLMGLDVKMEDSQSDSHCNICDLTFNPNSNEDIKIHSIRHKKCLEFINKNGFWWNYISRETIKSEAYRILGNPDLAKTKKIEAAENICQAYFCRCVEAWEFDPRHPSFEIYTAMLLRQKHFKELFNDIYDELVDKYGVMDGIEEGKTYINDECITTEKRKSPIDDNIKKYFNLNSTGKSKVGVYIDDLLCNPQYIDTDDTYEIAAYDIDETPVDEWQPPETETTAE